MRHNIFMLFITILVCFIISSIYAEEIVDYDYKDGEIFISLTRKIQPISEMPTNVSIVTEREIEKTGAKNIGQALDLTSNLNVGKYGTLGSMSSLILRGALDKQVLLLIDGRPANDVTLGGYNYGELSTVNIERVEVIRGAASSIYGANALAGVVNVITKETCLEKTIVNVNSSWGGFGEQVYGLNISKKFGEYESLISGSKLLSTGFRENSSCNNNFLDAYFGYDSDKVGKFKLKTGTAQYDLGAPGKNIVPINLWDNTVEKAAYDPLAKQKTNKNFFNLSHEKDLAKEFKLTSRLYGNADSGRYISPKSFIDDSTGKMSLGLEMQCNMPHGFTAGYELREDKAKRTDELMQSISYNEKVDFTSVYLQENISPVHNLNTIAGVRYDHHSYFGGETSPQLTVVWKAANNLKLSSNIGKSYRAPAFEDLFSPYSSWPAWGGFPGGDTQGNPNVKPETSISYDLGIEKEWNDGAISSKITLYKQDIDNLIEWSVVNNDPTFEQWRPSNVSQAYCQGIEFDLKHSVSEKLSYGLNYTYLDSKGKKITEAESKTLMYRPQNTVNLMMTWMMPQEKQS